MTAAGLIRRTIARILATWVGVPNVPAARRWAVVALVDAIGTGMFLPVSVLYLTVVVRLPVASVGAGLGIAGLFAAVVSPLAGPLIDRFGSKRAVLACLLLAGLGYAGYLAVHVWVAFVVVASVALAGDYLARPAKKVFVTAIVSGADRVPLIAFQRSVRNVGYGVGGLITAGLLLTSGRLGYQLVLVADALSYAAAAVLVLTIPAPRGSGAVTRRGHLPERPGFRQVLRDRRYLALAALDVLVLVYATTFTVGMPLWIHDHTSAPASFVGVLFTLNTILVTVLQVRLTKGYTRVHQARRLYLRTAGLFAVAALAYWAAYRLGGGVIAVIAVIAVLVVAVLVHTLAELYASVAEWTASVNLAPERLRAHYLSVYSLSMPVQAALGPGLVTLLIASDPSLAWFALAAVVGLGCLASAWLLRAAVEPDEQPTDPVTTSPATPGTTTQAVPARPPERTL